MKKLIKSITCLALVAALVASLAGCAKLNYVTNGTITAIQEVKSGDWKNAGKDGEADAAAEEDASVLDKPFEAGTYGGVEFKSLKMLQTTMLKLTTTQRHLPLSTRMLTATQRHSTNCSVLKICRLVML